MAKVGESMQENPKGKVAMQENLKGKVADDPRASTNKILHSAPINEHTYHGSKEQF